MVRGWVSSVLPGLTVTVLDAEQGVEVVAVHILPNPQTVQRVERVEPQVGAEVEVEPVPGQQLLREPVAPGAVEKSEFIVGNFNNINQ